MGWARFPALQAGLSHNGLAALNGYQWSNPVPLIQHSYNEQEHVGNGKPYVGCYEGHGPRKTYVLARLA
jgi:hypothetical protein